MRRKIAGLLILALVVSSACACGSKKEETKSEPDTEISASASTEASTSEEDNREALFADAFARFETFVQEGKYEEAYLAAEEAAKCGDFEKKCADLSNTADDVSIIESTYVHLLNNDSIAAADIIVGREGSSYENFLQFIKDNTYTLEEKTISHASRDSDNLKTYIYDDSGRITYEKEGTYAPEITYEYGNKECVKRYSGKFDSYWQYDDEGRLIYEYHSGIQSRLYYDETGNLIREEYGKADNADFYEYDKFGHLICKKGKSGDKYAWDYDEEGRLIGDYKENGFGTVSHEYSYDAQGRRIKWLEKDWNDTIKIEEYEYDDKDRIVSVQGSKQPKQGELVKFETVKTYFEEGIGVKWSRKSDDGQNAHGFEKYNSLGDVIEYSNEKIVENYEGELEKEVSAYEKEYKYDFFIKAAPEDEEKNLFEYVTKDKNLREVVPVDKADADNYRKAFKIITEGFPVGDIAIIVENTFTYCYAFDESVNIDDVELQFKHTGLTPNEIDVYFVYGDEEKLIGDFSPGDKVFDDSEVADFTSFYPQNAVDHHEYVLNYNGELESKPCELRNYSKEAGTIEADFGTETKTSFSGGVRVLGLDGIFETVNISDDVVIVSLNQDLYPAFVTKEYFEKHQEPWMQYYVAMDHGMIVYIWTIISA